MPWRISVWVWPPQTSMIVHGRVTVRAMSSSSARATSSSRYSSRYLMPIASGSDAVGILRQVDVLEVAHLREQRVGARGLLLVHHADREPDVDHDPVADARPRARTRGTPCA